MFNLISCLIVALNNIDLVIHDYALELLEALH